MSYPAETAAGIIAAVDLGSPVRRIGRRLAAASANKKALSDGFPSRPTDVPTVRVAANPLDLGRFSDQIEYVGPVADCKSADVHGRPATSIVVHSSDSGVRAIGG